MIPTLSRFEIGGGEVNYQNFLHKKSVVDRPTGLSSLPPLNDMLFDFQQDIVSWALKRGRAALFADCGMGKTAMQLEWSRVIHQETGGNVLILAPLAVSSQTAREGEKFGVEVRYCRSQEQVGQGVTITNYEMLSKFDPSEFVGVVLDESSILKSYTGKVRNQIIESFRNTSFRLACTATPAPNDHMELGNHAEFLGAMSRTEMLSMFFVHDGGETQKWRLKGHASDDFWRWVSSWAVMVRKPSDLGYDDGGFVLPDMEIVHHVVKKDEAPDGFLFPVEALTLQERQQERKATIDDRAKLAAQIANETDGPCLVWCNLNDESAAAKSLIDGAVEVKGADKPEHKEQSLLGFPDGRFRVLVSKPSIAGFGMNWQHCNTMIFLGLSDSYEQFYQAVRRCWRFGQKNKVTVHVVTAETEGAVVKNIERKEADTELMASEMVKHMADLNGNDIHGTVRQKVDYVRDVAESENWKVFLGDCVDVAREINDDSIDFSIFSPPFSSLYTYSASDRDMGNCKNDQEFADHFCFLVPELLRITKPGRLCAFHCMNLPTSKARDGVIGIKDFRGQLIKTFQDAGWIYHSEVVIWKDPVTAMQRTKALGLLHKQLKKDSCMSRQGVPDYLVVMRKPGENPEPVTGELTHFAGDQSTFQQTKNLSIDVWQRYASPVWMDINPSNTLQRRSAREDKDERHICPLQLDVIERALQLWTNPGDLVFSPFTGIGSEGYQSLKMGRRFVGAELKESYWRQAVKNLKEADADTAEQMSFIA
jgi:DNA modification methylase